MKLLLPLDLKQPYEPIVEMLDQSLPLKQYDVKLLYVRETLPAYENVMKTVGNFPDDWEKQLDAKANAYFDKVRAKLEPLCKSVVTEIISGPAAMMIETVAKDERFDVVVVAPGEHKPLERIFTGSTAVRLLTHAPATVLLLRAYKSPVAITSVVIGVDGSSNAKRVLERAVDMFNLTRKGTKVTLVHSVDVAEPLKLFSPVAFISSLEQDLLMRGEVHLAEGKNLLAEKGVNDVQCALVEGEPAASLIKMIGETQADLVLLGAQGDYSTHFLLGDTAYKVATHATCSVAVVRVESNKK